MPVLGICYGSQLMAHLLGGKVETAPVSEYGKTQVKIASTGSKLFQDVSEETICWMSHTDYISQAPEGFSVTASTPVCPVAAMENEAEGLYAVQFHPEVLHTVEGSKMLSNFVYNVCKCAGDWRMDSFVESTIQQLKEKTINAQILLVFFMPLALAGLHLICAYPMISKLMVLFTITDMTLIKIVTCITFVMIGVFYGIVYKLTSHTYYKIIHS